MKADIHPEYKQVQVSCSCGSQFTTGTTYARDFHIEVCSECHPFYTGKQKNNENEGRVMTFNKRFKNFAGLAQKSQKDKA